MQLVVDIQGNRHIHISEADPLPCVHQAHLDLKSPNILLSKDGEAKIADVGLNKIIAGPSAVVSAAMGSYMYVYMQMNGSFCTAQFLRAIPC